MKCTIGVSSPNVNNVQQLIVNISIQLADGCDHHVDYDSAM